MAKNLLSASEAAKFLGISRIAVFKKVRQGRFSAMMIARGPARHARQAIVLPGSRGEAGEYAMTHGTLSAEKKRMQRRNALRALRRKDRAMERAS